MAPPSPFSIASSSGCNYPLPFLSSLSGMAYLASVIKRGRTWSTRSFPETSRTSTTRRTRCRSYQVSSSGTTTQVGRSTSKSRETGSRAMARITRPPSASLAQSPPSFRATSTTTLGHTIASRCDVESVVVILGVRVLTGQIDYREVIHM